MCITRFDGYNPAAKLAAIIGPHLGVVVSPAGIEKLIKDRWDEIAPLAHAIHGSEMPKKAVLCKDDPNWDWWLGQSPEFKAAGVAAIRMLADAKAFSSEPEFFNEVELGSTGASHGRL